LRSPGHYYLLNNYNPGYFGNGNNAYTDTNANNTVFTIPPSSVRSIGDSLLAKQHFLEVLRRPVEQLCSRSVPAELRRHRRQQRRVLQHLQSVPVRHLDHGQRGRFRTAHIQDTANLYADIANGTLPAVSFVKPSGLVDGHPSSSKLDLFEGFSKKIVDAVKANPTLWKDTAIFITFDEGGGYYDSGYVQPLDFFGDGTRIPLIVVSPYTKRGHISHEYSDHVSILKFIERTGV
jgi:phospholipase C